MGVQIPAQAIADSAAAGELWQIVLAIAGPESSWRADAIGDAGCSIGYLQMNMCGGLGAPYSRETLLHGPTNFRLGAEYIRGRLSLGASLWGALQPWSARPAAWTLYQRILAEGVDPVGGGTPLPHPGPTPIDIPPGVNLAAVGLLAAGAIAVWWILS